MFKLVGTRENDGEILFAIQDTEDMKIDIVEEAMVMQFLKVGLQIGGIELLPDKSDFMYNEDFYFKEITPTSTDAYSFEDEVSESNTDNEEDTYDYDYGYDDEYTSDDSDSDLDSYGTDDYEDSEGYSNTDEDTADSEDYDYDYEYDYEDYDPYEREESPVSKLYSHLTADQIRVLKMYYLWYSQNIFNVAQKDPSLRMKSASRRQAKIQALDGYRNSGGLWHYAGFVDTGFLGGGSCSLGHELRYLHLAWDVTVSSIEESFWGDKYTVNLDDILQSNNVIVFGIKCITDFFEVDEDCMKALLKAQRESLREMEFMSSVYEKGEIEESLNSFKLLDSIMPSIIKKNVKNKLLLGDKYSPIVPEGLLQFYLKFKEVNMLYPKSLVQGIRDALLDWKDHKFLGLRPVKSTALAKTYSFILDKSTKDLFDLYGNKSDFLSYYGSTRTKIGTTGIYLWMFLFREIAGIYMYDPYTKGNKDEGGGSQSQKYWLDGVYRGLKNNFWKDNEFSLEYLKKVFLLASLSKELVAKVVIPEVPKAGLANDGIHQVVSYMSIDRKYFFYDMIESFDKKNNTSLHDIYNYAEDLQFKAVKQITFIDDAIALVTKYLENYDKDLKSFLDAEVAKFEEIVNNYNQEIDKREASKKLEEQKVTTQQETKDVTDRISDTSVNSDGTVSISDKDLIEFLLKETESIEVVEKLNSINPIYCKILNSVANYKKGSTSQMYYLKTAYKALTGHTAILTTEPTDRVEMDDVLEERINKVVSQEAVIVSILGVEEATKSLAIVKNLVNFTRVSKKQLVHLTVCENALQVYNNSVK